MYELYWHYASQRHSMFERRVAGSPPPWTDDPILASYKFCNVYRAADRVSQYMIRDVCYHDEDCTPQDRIFQIVAFRTFSKIDTWRSVRDHLGRYPTLEDLAAGAFTAALDHAAAVNGGLYTGAFILCATDAYGQGRKHFNHVELWRHMFLADHLADRVLDATSLRQIYDLLHGYPLMGNFMSYQTAIDLNYSALLDFSENEVTQAGPGALRGIRKCFIDLGDFSPTDVIMWMLEHQAEELDRLEMPFRGLYGRPLHAIDCQGLFCETDKYCREAAPELASARSRIKARFTQTPAPMRLFCAPTWGITDALPTAAVYASAKQARSCMGRSRCSSPIRRSRPAPDRTARTPLRRRTAPRGCTTYTDATKSLKLCGPGNLLQRPDLVPACWFCTRHPSTTGAPRDRRRSVGQVRNGRWRRPNAILRGARLMKAVDHTLVSFGQESVPRARV